MPNGRSTRTLSRNAPELRLRPRSRPMLVWLGSLSVGVSLLALRTAALRRDAKLYFIPPPTALIAGVRLLLFVAKRMTGAYNTFHTLSCALDAVGIVF
jgi:hypothetical protein